MRSPWGKAAETVASSPKPQSLLAVRCKSYLVALALTLAALTPPDCSVHRMPARKCASSAITILTGCAHTNRAAVRKVMQDEIEEKSNAESERLARALQFDEYASAGIGQDIAGETIGPSSTPASEPERDSPSDADTLSARSLYGPVRARWCNC